MSYFYNMNSKSPRLYIYCPYQDKEKAKKIGARWDPYKKSWYLTNKATFDQLTTWKPSKTIEKPSKSIEKSSEIPCTTDNPNRWSNISTWHNTLPSICSTDGCINVLDSYDKLDICDYCNFKIKTAGGLKCNGWMSVPCKYNGITVKNSWSCPDCNNDSRCMIGAFDNDRS